MKAGLKIIKIGGAVIDHAPDLEIFLRDFAALDGPKILVHGGGRGASDLLAKLGLAPQLVNGRRITDAATLDAVTMFYAGKTNKQIVASLQKIGVNALGISGADGNVVQAIKRPVGEVDYGFVGDLAADSVNAELLRQLLALGLTPVLCAITHDGRGQLLNTNADTVAAALATALSKAFAVELIYCFEKKGVLLDVSDDESVIARITAGSYAHLKTQGIIVGGMLPKLDNAFAALQQGVAKVVVASALHLNGPTRTELWQS